MGFALVLAVLLAALSTSSTRAAEPEAEPRCASESASRSLPQFEASLRDALASRKLSEMGALLERYRCAHEDTPLERREQYRSHRAIRPLLSARQATAESERLWSGQRHRFYWLQPNQPDEPLRNAASVIEGALTLWRLTDDIRYLSDARAAGDYLLQAQQQAGTGGFGFPAPPPGPPVPGDRDEIRAAKAFLARVVQQRRAPPIVAGWIVDDYANGDLNYDAGLAGEALLNLAEATGDHRYRRAALLTADWLIPRPIVLNFNYNGFAVALLARAYQATGRKMYLDEAVARARLGVLSGQLKDGPNAGSWIDPHNRRIVYRLIMIRQLAVLAKALPERHSFAAELATGLRLALDAVERQARANGGVANLHSAPLAYCELAGLTRTQPWLNMRARDVEWAHMDFALQAALRGEGAIGPSATACLIAYAATPAADQNVR